MADARQVHHQPPGISTRGMLWGAGSIVVGIVLAASAAYVLWQHWSDPESGPNAERMPEISQPQLQAAPQEERAQYFAEKRKLLESAEWIDREKGIARIPLQEAMQILAAQGRRTPPVRKEGQ